MKHKTMADLVSMMEYQFPRGVTTWGPCGNGCGGSGRGGNACRYCIAKEIDSRTGRDFGARLIDALDSRNKAQYKVEALTELILDVK